MQDYSEQYITYAVNEIVDCYTEKGYGELAEEKDSEGYCVNAYSLEFDSKNLQAIGQLIKGYRAGAYDRLI